MSPFIGNHRGLVDRDEYVVTFESKGFDNLGGVFEPGQSRFGERCQMLVFEGSPNDATGNLAGPGRIEADECFAHGPRY